MARQLYDICCVPRRANQDFSLFHENSKKKFEKKLKHQTKRLSLISSVCSGSTCKRVGLLISIQMAEFNTNLILSFVNFIPIFFSHVFFGQLQITLTNKFVYFVHFRPIIASISNQLCYMRWSTSDSCMDCIRFGFFFSNQNEFFSRLQLLIQIWDIKINNMLNGHSWVHYKI